MSDYEILCKHIELADIHGWFGEPGVHNFSGMQNPAHVIKGDVGIRAYLAIAKKIHSDRKIRGGYTFPQVQKVLDQVLASSLAGKKVSESDVLTQAKKLLPVDSQNDSYKVYRNVYGLKLSRFRSFGRYRFHRGSAVKKHFSKIRSLTVDLDSMSDYVVVVSVDSVTAERALEIADEHFESLEILFAFLVGEKDSGYDIRILKPSKRNLVFHALKSESGRVGFGSSIKKAAHWTLDIDDEFFRAKYVKRMFALVGNEPASTMDRKIRNAILWIGKGLESKAPIDSLMSYCSAMEALLVRQKGVVISPSIIASLSEYAAFLLGKGVDDRKEIAIQIKKIYTERSAGAHGGKLVSDVSIEAQALAYSQSLVFAVMKLYPARLSNDEELASYIESKKYT